MTSYSQIYRKSFQYLGVTTPSYLDTTIIGPSSSSNTSGTIIPIPFSYKNGVLDINNQNNVMVNLVNSEGQYPQSYMYTTVKEMGGIGLVSKLGPNMLTWLKNWLSSMYPNPKFSIDQQATVIKLQMPLQSGNLIDGTYDGGGKGPNALIGFQGTFTITPSAPTTNFVTGDQSTNFYTFWAFRTPLVIKVVYNSGTVFITLNSNFGYSGG